MPNQQSSFWDRLRGFFEIPEMQGIDLDAPETTALRRDLIRRDPAKRFAFDIWYRVQTEAVEVVPTGKKSTSEPGGSFLNGRHHIPDCSAFFQEASVLSSQENVSQ